MRRAPPHIQQRRWEKEVFDVRTLTWKPVKKEKPEPKRSHIDGRPERAKPEPPERGRNSEKDKKKMIELPPPRIKNDPQPGDILTPRWAIRHPVGWCKDEFDFKLNYFVRCFDPLMHTVDFHQGMNLTYLGNQTLKTLHEASGYETEVCQHMFLFQGKRINVIGTRTSPGEIWDYFDPIKRAK